MSPLVNSYKVDQLAVLFGHAPSKDELSQLSKLPDKEKKLLDVVVSASVKGDSEALHEAKWAYRDYTCMTEYWLGRAK